MKNIVLIGIQGSGKGTQARILIEKFGYILFETGAELRKIAEENTSLGKSIKAILERGDLVSNDITMQVIDNFLNNTPPEKAIIFDSMPRFEEQRISFEALAAQKQRDFIVLEIHLSKEEAIKRLLKRATIEKRADDTPAGIERRIQNFYDHTKPMLEAWKKEGKVISINGEQSVEEVSSDILKALSR